MKQNGQTDTFITAHKEKEIAKMERPEFNEIKDYDEFCKYYWYREELINEAL